MLFKRSFGSKNNIMQKKKKKNQTWLKWAEMNRLAEICHFHKIGPDNMLYV